MIKTEFKNNYKSLLIWSSIISLLFVIVIIIYPSLNMDEQMVSELMSVFPKEMLSIFNMDMLIITSAFNWVMTEGYMFLTLIGSIYAAILGGTILLKESDDKTIEFLASKPISRNKIITSKLLVGITNILLFNIIVSIILIISLLIINDLNLIKFLLMIVSNTLINIFFFSISFFVANYFKKTRTSIGLGASSIFLFYVFFVLAEMSNKTEFLKYITPFSYLNLKTVIQSSSLDLFPILMVSISSIIFIILTYVVYNRKELSI